MAKQRVSFTLSAPAAQSVLLVGDFTRWEQEAIRLKKQKEGVWKVSVSLAPGRYEYRFLVDGSWQDDPACTERSPNSFGAANCVRVVA
jgi:1,4-alpha-glucan branching enzyme